jgi:hypothetical protein
VVCGAGDLSGHALTGVVYIGEGPEYRPFGELRSVPDALTGVVYMGAGPEYRPFGDLRSVPEAGRPREPVETHGRACTKVLFQRNVELGFFHVLEIVTGWLVPSAGQKIPVQHGWYLPPQKIPLAKTGFFSRQGS